MKRGLPAFVKEDGSPRFKDYPDYIVNHQRMPGVGPLAGFRGNGEGKGVGEPNPDQLNRYIENGCFWRHHLPDEQLYFKHANKAYLDDAKAMGLIGKADQIVLQIYSEPLQKFRLAAQGHGPKQPPDEETRARIATYCDPLPIWYAPLEQQQHDTSGFPLSAVTQRPMDHYHSWGSQNAWLRQIRGANKLYMHRLTGHKLGLEHDDWVWVESRSGRVKGQLALMDGVNLDTVWTWNAIGKRRGAWNLSPDSPEATRGFLLNHVISEWLPAQEAAYRFANSDPVTGQAAWYDLRVRVTKCAPGEAHVTDPHPEALKPPLPPAPSMVKEPGK